MKNEKAKQNRRKLLISYIIYLILFIATWELISNKTIVLILALIYSLIISTLAKNWGKEAREALKMQQNNIDDEKNNIHFGN